MNIATVYQTYVSFVRNEESENGNQRSRIQSRRKYRGAHKRNLLAGPAELTRYYVEWQIWTFSFDISAGTRSQWYVNRPSASSLGIEHLKATTIKHFVSNATKLLQKCLSKKEVNEPGSSTSAFPKKSETQTRVCRTNRIISF